MCINLFKEHTAYKRTFQENKLTLGMIFPLEAYQGNVPKMDMEEQIKLAKLAEKITLLHYLHAMCR